MLSWNLFSQGDTPCTALTLTVNNSICGVFTAGTTAGATYSNNAANGGTPTCAIPGSPDVWYSFVATSGLITITTTSGTITDSGIQLYSSATNTCTTLTALNCDDDSGPGLMSELNLCGLTIGNKYWIRLWSYSSGSGTFGICAYTQTMSINTQNCSGSTQVCNDASFVGNSSGAGTQELNVCNQGCLSTEHQSSWYIFQAATSGTIALTITTAVDYDFAIWGPNVACSALGAPVRCSFAAGGGNTGLGNGATDNSEGAGGDKWVAPLNVIAGQTYIMLIDNFASNSTAFTLDWTMTGGASLNCTPLPIELLYFKGDMKSCVENLLTWGTATELNNDRFEIERSNDGITFEKIAIVKGAGNSLQVLKYNYSDTNPGLGINYYRLKQVDYDSQFKYTNLISVDNSCGGKVKIVRITNLIGQEVGDEYEGTKIIQYNDGSVVRKFGYK